MRRPAHDVRHPHRRWRASAAGADSGGAANTAVVWRHPQWPRRRPPPSSSCSGRGSPESLQHPTRGTQPSEDLLALEDLDGGFLQHRRLREVSQIRRQLEHHLDRFSGRHRPPHRPCGYHDGRAQSPPYQRPTRDSASRHQQKRNEVDHHIAGRHREDTTQTMLRRYTLPVFGRNARETIVRLWFCDPLSASANHTGSAGVRALSVGTQGRTMDTRQSAQ